MLRLLLLCVIAFALADPTARAWWRPHLAPVLDPAYEWSVRSRVSEIARMIEADRAAGRFLPPPGEIDAYVERQYRHGGAGIDPWGSPYRLMRERVGARVVSAGRDATPDTEDDIRSQILFLD